MALICFHGSYTILGSWFYRACVVLKEGLALATHVCSAETPR